MGIDFSAILEYPGFDDSTMDAIFRLESSQVHEEFFPLQQLAIRKDQYAHVFTAGWSWQTEHVEDSHEVLTMQVKTPRLPDSNWALSTSAGFKIRFGERLISIYHPLRWGIFINDPDWQTQMLTSLKIFTNWFGATGCVLAHDCTAVVTYLDEPNLETAIKLAVEEWDQFEADSLQATVRSEPAPTEDDPHAMDYDSGGFWRFI